MNSRSLFFITTVFALFLSSISLPVQRAQAIGGTVAMPRIAQVSAGSGHALAIGEDGSLWSWGDNSSGQLGDGTFVSRSAPVQVGSDEDWKTAAAGDHFSIGIKKDGSLWMWGTNKKQQYVQTKNAVINQNAPVRYGKDTNWVKVTAGEDGAAALRQDGTIFVFGLNVLPGVIEDQTKLNDDTDWIDVSVGTMCLLALKQDGSLWAKGHCTPNGNSEPIELQQLGTDHDWKQMSAGQYSLALKEDGSVSMLWMGDTPSEVIAKPVPGLPKAVKVAGDFFAVVVGEDGTVMRWNMEGRFTILDAGAAMKDVDESYEFGVALSQDGVPWTYGDNAFGQLGAGESVSGYEPQQSDNTIKDQVKKESTVYTLRHDGTISSRRKNDTAEERFAGSEWVSIAASRDELYAMKQDGSLWVYQVTVDLEPNPDKVLHPFHEGTVWKDIQVSDLGFTVGLKQDGSLWIWGHDSWGFMLPGVQSYEDFAQPKPINSDTDWQSFSVSMDHLVAVKQNGTVWGIGDNRHFELSMLFNDQVSKFMRIGSDSDWIQVQTSETATVGLRKDGSLWQWGSNFYGYPRTQSDMALLSPDKDWTAIWVGTYRAFATKQDGSLWSWGDNTYGELGTGSAQSRHVPTRVNESGPWAGIYPQVHYTVGIKADGSVWTWGNESNSMYETAESSDMVLAPVRTQVQYRSPVPATVWSASFIPFTLKDYRAKVSTAPNKHVIVSKGSRLVAEGLSNESGIFEFSLPAKKDGAYTAQVTDISGDVLAKASYGVGDTTPPAIPKVTAAVAKSKLVKGYAEALSTVTVVSQGKSYQAKASNTRGFQVSVPALAAGESLRVWTTDAAGNKSQETKVKVAAAAAPKK